MSFGKVVYMQEQKDFIKKLLLELPEVSKLWEKNPKMWGDPSFFTELHPFMSLTKKALVAEDNDLAKKILNLIEGFLNGVDEESKNAIAYFFFEDLINSLSWKDKKYTKTFIKMLGPHSEECCKIADKFWEANTECLWDKKQE